MPRVIRSVLLLSAVALLSLPIACNRQPVPVPAQAPPPKALSPVYPTPKFSAGNEAEEKFGSPKSSPEKSGVSAAEIGPPATDDPPAAPVEN